MNLISLNFKNNFKNIEQIEKLRLFLVLLYVFFLPYNLFYTTIIFITLFVLTLIDLSKEKIKTIPKQVWIFQLIYFIAVLFYNLSIDRTEANYILERQLVILLFPLILPLSIKINQVNINLILITLTLTCVLSILYLFFYLFYLILFELKLPLIKTISSGYFFNHGFSKPISIHASYFSLYISLSILYSVQILNSLKVFFNKLMMLLIIIILYLGLFFLASRNSIICVFIILLFIFPFFKIYNKKKYLLISILFFVLSFIIIFNITYFKNRFSGELISDIKPLNNKEYVNYSYTEPRIERWRCAFDLIKKSPLIGYGTGDEVTMLKTEYSKKGLFISYLENFNAHNQYISYLIKCGIIGFVLFLFSFFYFLYLAIKDKNFIYLSFLIILLIGFYTENILDSNKGIVFFAFFNTLFGYMSIYNLNNKRV